VSIRPLPSPARLSGILPYLSLLLCTSLLKAKSPDLDAKLLCSVSRILVGVVRKVDPARGTNAKPPRVTLDVKMTLKGPETEGEVTGIWQPRPHGITETGPEAQEMIEDWKRFPMRSPRIGKPWVVLVEPQGKDLIFLHEARGISSRPHLIKITEALECGHLHEESFPGSRSWEDIPSPKQNLEWKEIQVFFSIHTKGGKRSFLVQENGSMTLSIRSPRTRKAASRTRRTSPGNIQILLQELQDAGLFEGKSERPPRSARTTLRVRTRRDGEEPPALVLWSCNTDCPEVILRTQELLGKLWKRAR
jgi:hypothetical protein